MRTTVEDEDTGQLLRGRLTEQVVEQVAEQLAERVAAHLVAQWPAVDRPREDVPGTGTGAPAGPAPGAAQLVHEGEFWTLRFEGRTTRLRDRRGLHHLARLLARPDEPVHVLELSSGPGGLLADDLGMPVLDARAKSEYRRRLRELEELLDEAQSRGDGEGQELVAAERDFLVLELHRALGLGGRDRTTCSPAERARVAVTKALRSTVRAVEQHDRRCGAHLDRSVRTGLLCSYRSEAGVQWTR